MNGGLPILLVQLYKKLTKTDLIAAPVATPDFNLVDLNTSDDDIDRLKRDLEVRTYNLKNHLLTNSSEAQYRSLFSDEIISTLFFIGDSAFSNERNIEDSLP